jgi:hypothetical protein
VFSSHVAIVLLAANVGLTAQLVREMMAAQAFCLSSLIIVIAAMAILAGVVIKLVWNLFFGYVIVFTYVKDRETEEEEFHAHTKRGNDKWLDAQDWFHDSPKSVEAVLAALYGGGFRRLFKDPLSKVYKRHPWSVYPGKKADYVIVDTGDNIGLHVTWRQALKIACQELGYATVYKDRKSARKERDDLIVEMVSVLDFLEDTRHSVGRSQPAARKRRELEDFMIPLLVQHERRLAGRIELKLRRDQVPTEPDLRGSDLDIVDDESGFFLADHSTPPPSR